MKLSERRRVDPRTLVAIGHDITMAAVAWGAAFWLRLNLSLPEPYDSIILSTMGLVVCVEALIFVACRLYRGIWRYASVYDFRRILVAVGLAALTIPAIFLLLQLPTPIPRSVFLLNPLLLIVLMGGGRFAFRLWRDSPLNGALVRGGTPILILGVNDLAERLVRELGPGSRWRVVGLLDKERRRLGRDIHGVRVVGLIKNVARIARERDVGHVVLAIPGSSFEERRRAMQLAAAAGLRVLSAPSFEDLLTGRAAISQLKDVDIEDLLGRTPVSLESTEVAQLIHGRTLFITGAGGSIGSELARQIAIYKPRLLVLLDICEYALFQIEQSLRRQFPNLAIVCATGDVKDRARIATLLSHYKPEIVFHAAAYKHVPLMETINAWEAIRNNALGTYEMASAAISSGVEKFVLVSTDKAVNPTNVMGASKRLAEIICQGLQRGAVTKLVTVRFGNVLGSAGSVVPTFQQQIAEGGPVTVTHPEVTRYFMSIPEASQLVLRAGAAGTGGEVYVLDMGSPVKVLDLAREMIRLSGMTEEDVPIVFTGLRPGEKLYEELLADGEHTLPTPNPKLRIARARSADVHLFNQIIEWINSAAPATDEAIRSSLRMLVPEYSTREASSVAHPVSENASLPLSAVVNR